MKFAQEIKKWSDEALSNINQAKRAACLELARSVILDTPVKTGKARANWQASLNQAADGVLEQTDISGEAAMARVEQVLANMKLGDSFVLSNNLPYVAELEDGSSNQAPNGMLKRNVASWPSLVKKASQGGKS